MGTGKIERLQAEYDRLRTTLKPQLEELSRSGDEQADAMRRLFAEASAAWDSDDRASAKAFSEQGHAAKAKSEAANTEANDLRNRLHGAQSALTAARSAYQSAPVVYGTRVIGFERTHGWSAATVQEFLRHLPARPFAEIDAIEYQDVIDAQARAGVTERLHDAHHKANITLFRPPIALTGKEFNTYQAWTLVHEYGHVLLDRVVSKEVLHEWKSLYLARRRDVGAAWVSKLASTSAREDFSESFAAYLLKPSSLQRSDPEKYEIIKSIHEDL